jgi:hypothetical protein
VLLIEDKLCLCDSFWSVVVKRKPCHVLGCLYSVGMSVVIYIRMCLLGLGCPFVVYYPCMVCLLVVL